MVELLLTDIDGTLVDSNTLHAESWRRAFEQHGISIGMDEAWRQIGKGGDQVIPVFVPEGDRERLEKPLKALRGEIFHRDYMPRVVAFGQARELLQRVRAAEIRIALATSSEPEDLKVYGEIVGMDDLIEKAATSADAESSKPEPDIFAAALEKAGVSAEQAVALGDTPYDAESAGKLGIRTIGLTCGGWKREDLLAAGCAEVYRDPGDLLAHFDESLLGRR